MLTRELGECTLVHLEGQAEGAQAAVHPERDRAEERSPQQTLEKEACVPTPN